MARTKGSRNKRSVGIPAELRDALGHRDPAVVLAEVYSMDQGKLSALVRSAKGARAMAFRVQAAIAAMPYVHSKMPVAESPSDDEVPTIVIDRLRHQMQQNQTLIDVTPDDVRQPAVRQDSQAIETKEQSNE